MVRPVDCLIALGSNLGNKARTLRRAMRELEKLPGTRLLCRSSFHRTKAVGPGEQPDYLNAAARLRTSLSPMGLLIELKRIEAACGRRPGRRWGPRPLDLDILRYGNLKLKNRWLTLPHPLALKRGFVLKPLAELKATLK